ncbi:phenylalanine--tRNA ligase beta subunit-related protein [uncultured Duncaniella sp.]|uniref:B3/B4 domain-containing protein n=1 Tax=uncultured Duncaniella sp. TaxID=2768039 RepID=UPI0025A9FCA1|nr:phenylalanine--tRNA ligase beta subunit-related protein [uncultured Duncaniella sp.]
MDIRIEDTIRQAAPGLLVVAIEADVTNGETSEELWALLNRAAADIRDITELPDINRRPGIRATRDAYKALGKEPNRYRPSAEALCRRAVKGMELYRINALVDLINLVSLLSGYSIGGFDADRIQGEVLSLGVGREGEPFEAIGRGVLNIACMPVYRDSIGGIGTPTSDNERTKLGLFTRRLLMCVNVYGEEMPVADTVRMIVDSLERFADAKNITINYYRP